MKMLTDPRIEQVSVKTCTKCKAEKPLSEFGKDAQKRDGLGSACRICKNAQSANYQKNNREKAIASRKEWQKKNPEKMREYLRRYKQKNISEIREMDRIRMANLRLSDPEKVKQAKRRYYLLHKEKILAKGKKYRLANPEVRFRNYKKNIERIRQKAEQYRKENKELFRSHSAKRRAMKRGAGGAYTVADLRQLMMLQRNKCACCGSSLKNGYDADHIVPLSRGGGNDKSNIQLLCVYCNRRKHAKDPVEFMQSRGFLI